jgi:hypothetical protein
MKKILFYLASASFLICNSSYADNNLEKSVLKDNSGEKCFDENTKVLNLGVGFGGINYYTGAPGYSYGRTPAFSLSYEQAIHKKLGPGYLGVGAYGGYQSAHARFVDYNFHSGNSYYYEHHWNYFMIAARAAYHFDFLNSPKAEVYAGAIVGVRIQTYHYETSDPDKAYSDAYRLHEGFVYPSFSLLAGARWYFVPKVALFAEVGWGISYGTVGVTFKL